MTPDGIKVAIFYTKLHNRLLRPLLAADQPQAPPELRAALRAIDQHIGTYITHARLTPAERERYSPQSESFPPTTSQFPPSQSGGPPS